MVNRTIDSLRRGTLQAVRRPALIFLLYAIQLLLALLVSLPVYSALDAATADSGFALQLAEQFDIVLWADIIEKAGPTLTGFLVQIAWIIPVVLVWKAVSSVGIIATLATDGLRTFWHGVGEFGLRSLLLAGLFLVPVIVIIVGVLLGVGVLSTMFSGEVAMYRINVILLPVSLIVLLSILDLMHDYARMELVLGDRNVLRSFASGVTWPFKHPSSVGLYVIWFTAALILFVLPTYLDVQPGGFWGVFALQQVILFCRAGATVGWFGSEAYFYDSTVVAELPAIAQIDAEPRIEGSVA